jgi:hypothetical protein
MAINRTDIKIEKLDEAIRGNGKEGLNSIVRRMDSVLSELNDSIESGIKQHVSSAIENLELRLQNKINSSKLRAITQDEIDKYNEKPGGWQEFRRTWLFPLILIVISTIVGGWISHVMWP